MTDKRMMLHLDEELAEEIENYRRQQTKIPSKAEAIRELIRIGLKSYKTDRIKRPSHKK